MPDINQNFEHSVLEADIEKLSREISEKRNLPEYKDVSEKELIKESLKPFLQQAGLTATVQNQPLAKDENSGQKGNILPSYLKDEPAEIKLQVEKLVDEVFHEGLKKAVAEAKKSGFFLEDAFHDALTEKFYEELRERGMLK